MGLSPAWRPPQATARDPLYVIHEHEPEPEPPWNPSPRSRPPAHAPHHPGCRPHQAIVAHTAAPRPAHTALRLHVRPAALCCSAGCCVSIGCCGVQVAFAEISKLDGTRGFFRGAGALMAREVPFYVAGMVRCRSSLPCLPRKSDGTHRISPLHSEWPAIAMNAAPPVPSTSLHRAFPRACMWARRCAGLSPAVAAARAL